MELLDDTCSCGHSEREHAIEAPSPCRAMYVNEPWEPEPCGCRGYCCAEAEEIYGEEDA